MRNSEGKFSWLCLSEERWAREKEELVLDSPNRTGFAMRQILESCWP